MIDLVSHIIGKIDFGTLAILFSLMAVVAGFTRLGYIDKVSLIIVNKSKNLRMMFLLAIYACFFMSMLITNDVALIVMVPFTIKLLHMTGRSDKMIKLIVMETIAANLGSMLTPIGNPQNVYLYQFYHMDIVGFFRLILPYAVAACAIILAVILLDKDGKDEVSCEDIAIYEGKIKNKAVKTLVFSVLFVVCMLTVLDVVEYYYSTAIVLVVFLIMDYKALREVNYGLLIKFSFLFILVGLLNDVEFIRDALTKIVSGHEVATGILASQALSNVPSAIMLSKFTLNGSALLLGCNLGGLGTMIASMASMISYNYYGGTTGANKKRYMGIFTIYNLLFLAIMVLEYIVIG